MSCIFGWWPKKKMNASSIRDELNKTVEMHEKEKKDLQEKMQKEVEKKKEFTQAKNQIEATECMNRKKIYKGQIKGRINQLRVIHQQMTLLDETKAIEETVAALKTGLSGIKAIKMDVVDKTLDNINEHTETVNQIQEAFATFTGAAADLDEEEAELEEQLPQPPVIAQAAQYTAASRRSNRRAPQSSTTTKSSSGSSGATTC